MAINLDHRFFDGETRIQHPMTDYWYSILESLEDEIIIINRKNVVTWANAATHRRWNATKEGSPIGLPCHVVNHGGVPCTSDGCNCPIPEVLATGHSSQVIHHHTTGEDSGRFVEVLLSPLQSKDSDVQEVVEVVRDVTRRYIAQQALLRRNRELDALNRVTAAVGSSLNLNQVLNTTLEVVLEVTELDAGAIYLQRDKNLVLHAHRNIASTTAQSMRKLLLTDSPCGIAITLGRPIITHHVSDLPDPQWDAIKSERLQTLIHIPLKADQRTFGSMCLGSRSEHLFDHEAVNLLTALGNQIGVAIERSILHEELAHKERMRQALLDQVITAQEDERQRIARELHDEIMQSISAILYNIEAISNSKASDNIPQKAQVVLNLAQKTLDELNNLIYDLRPSLLDNLGLLSALRWLLGQHLENQNILVQILINGQPFAQTNTDLHLTKKVEIAIFRVLQEAINNIADHAQAQHVLIQFEWDADRLSITIEDDGIGFELDEALHAKDMKRGLGLMGMWERMELLGGSLIISSSPGEGTAVSLTCPIKAEKSDG